MDYSDTIKELGSLIKALDAELERHKRLAQSIESWMGGLSREIPGDRCTTKNEWFSDIDGTIDVIRDADGNLLKNVFVPDDATQRNGLKNRNRHQAEMFAMLLGVTGAGIWKWNVKSGDLVVNERTAQIIGYSLKELQPFHIDQWVSLCHPEDIHQAMKMLKAHFAGRQPFFIIEYRMRHKDGRWVWVEMRGREIERSPDGKVLRMIGILFDISQRKHAEAEKQRLERMNYQLQKADSLGRMAGAIAHRFNNQLHVVMGNLQMVRDDVPEHSETRIMIQDAFNAAQRAAQVSGMMLTYLGQRAGVRLPVNLCTLVREAVSLLEAMVPRGFCIEVDIPESDVIVQANQDYVQQMLINVVVNAWEAGEGEIIYPVKIALRVVESTSVPEHKRYRVNWQPNDGSYACIEVVDSGKGIEEINLDRLFDPFFTTKSLGRGMGLAVVLSIVQSHGGGITIHSRPGKGTVFDVFLPIAEES